MVEMPGCCPPSAMRALHCAWSHAVTATDEGVWVNLALDRDVTRAWGASHLPRRSCLEVEARTAGDVLIRPPEWAPRDRVELRRNGSGHSVRWGGPEGAYVVCDRASPGDRLELEWPLVRFRQTLAQQFAVNSEEEEARFEVGPAYTFSWTGSTVTDVEPGGVWLPWCPCP